ncbi:MAG TPA: PfkB family carbohydrate kinase [Pseudomonadota bacterium]|nr:PfkB family carbohydrate kinase [Pseudomonadota bacterium]HNI60940.1 PfkB family carbohydrate kinase [Pseudomonadota bacterium]HNK43786.1 PfkB family carbohydrate kinase [Pseudomonadota bacterium]HNN52137.1 PfkB family carbohydrate kinase [Pseudomonadota bacterium]HNO68126.1 PfkB family carbohydrate kinase [Pseudomonadota bacterium]
MSSQLDLLVVGSVALDTVETQAATRTEVLGGSASYFSAAASFLTSVGLVGVVGDDFPDEHAQFLTRLGVDSQGLERRDAGKTFRWHGRYSDDFNKRTSIDTQLNVFADFEPKLHPAHASARLLFLGNIDPTLQLRVLEQMKSVELVGLDTMNFWINGSREALLKVLRRVDFLLLNDEEARLLSGRHNLVHAAQAIQRLGPKNVVVKRGDAGALLFHDEHIFAAPALPLTDVVDPTGAGDSFAGGFMGFLSRTWKGGNLDGMLVRRAMICGSTMASFCCEDFSLDRFRSITHPIIDSRFRAFRQLTHFEDLVL